MLSAQLNRALYMLFVTSLLFCALRICLKIFLSHVRCFFFFFLLLNPAIFAACMHGWIEFQAIVTAHILSDFPVGPVLQTFSILFFPHLVSIESIFSVCVFFSLFATLNRNDSHVGIGYHIYWIGEFRLHFSIH